MSVSEIIALVIGLSGLSGLVFTALRYRRDDTTAIVNQQSTILHDIQTLNGELRLALQNCEERGRASAK